MQKKVANYFNPIQQLALSFDLQKPSSWTWRKYLKTLGHHAGIPEDITRQLIEEGEKYRFDNQSPDDSILENWLVSLKKYLKTEPAKQETVLAQIRKDIFFRSPAMEQPVQAEISPEIRTEKVNFVNIEKDFEEPSDTANLDLAVNEKKEANGNSNQSIGSKKTSFKVIIPLIAMWSLMCVGIGIFFKHDIIIKLPIHAKRAMLGSKEYDKFRTGNNQHNISSELATLTEKDMNGNLKSWYGIASRAESYQLYGKAILVYRRILSSQPDDTSAMQKLAMLHLNANKPYALDYYEAFRLLEKARRIEIENKGTLSYPLAYTSAICESQLGEYAQAAIYMQQAINAYKGLELRGRRARRRLARLYDQLNYLNQKAEEPQKSA